MSYQSNNLNLEVLEEGDPADLTTVSDNFDKIDANVGNVATFETSPATAAHNIGDYIIYQGHVHRVTANISEGNYLIRGTNISYTDVWHEIKSLRDSVSSLIHVEMVEKTISSGNSKVSVSAPLVNGYSFLCWFATTSFLWNGYVFAEYSDASTTDVYVGSTSSSDRKVHAFALYLRD